MSCVQRSAPISQADRPAQPPPPTLPPRIIHSLRGGRAPARRSCPLPVRYARGLLHTSVHRATPGGRALQALAHLRPVPAYLPGAAGSPETRGMVSRRLERRAPRHPWWSWHSGTGPPAPGHRPLPGPPAALLNVFHAAGPLYTTINRFSRPCGPGWCCLLGIEGGRALRWRRRRIGPCPAPTPPRRRGASRHVPGHALKQGACTGGRDGASVPSCRMPYATPHARVGGAGPGRLDRKRSTARGVAPATWASQRACAAAPALRRCSAPRCPHGCKSAT